MSYHFLKSTIMRFDDAVASTKEALSRHNFDVLTEIDMRDVFRKTLDVDFHPYLILGVCNPQLSYRALRAEDKIGTMLPCNIIIQQQGGYTEISAVDPVASMQAITNVEVGAIANDIRSLLQRVMDEVGNQTGSCGGSRTART